jgi:hypothetical protein
MASRGAVVHSAHRISPSPVNFKLIDFVRKGKCAKGNFCGECLGH